MKRILSLMVLASALLGAGGASAQTLRWATQGDAQTMDPHSQNEQLTNSMNAQVYEYLVGRDQKLALVPALATDWEQLGPLRWRMKLRPNVKFHDGTPFTADDVVFSINRAKEPTSQIAAYANACGEPKKIDDLTVEFELPQVNPIFLQHMNNLFIMSKGWSENNKTTKPLDYKNKEESYASFNANGTGPYMLVSRQPGIKTTYKRNPNWWGKFEGNVQEVIYTQIASDATRLAALVSGEIDFILDPAPRDLARLRNTAGVKVVDGLENRILFIGMDQGRDELLYGSVKGKNPFKDVRVRRALYQAVDIETIKTKLMNNQAFPTGAVVPSSKGSFNDPEIEKRLPYDVAVAKKLMADAGYPSGFEVTLDCPNNRYINDEEICVALAGMWSQLGVKVRVNAMPRATFFAKLDKLDTSMYMLGWGGAITDAEVTLTPIYRNRGAGGVGYYNYGNYKNDALDEVAAASSREPDIQKREQLIKTALKMHNEAVHHIPLHRQVIPWAARANVDVVHRADNFFSVEWVRINNGK